MHDQILSSARTVCSLTVSCLSFFLFLSVHAQNMDNLNAPVPPDPKVRIGKLENGFTYYIRKNSRPEKRVEFRLVVKTGSIMEDDAQQGLAHFCEHMAFNGSKHFKKNELIDYMESVGVKFGPHVNAYTSFDETVYMFQMPTDRQGVLDTAFIVLEDWAHNLSFDSLEVEKERGVVIEEWRLGKGADERMRNKYFPVLYKNSHYAERLPIGKKEIIENFKHDVLKRFYSDWYRPDLMALVIVGDIDVYQMEAKIKQHFSAIPRKENPRPLQLFPVPDHKETLIAKATDKEARGTNIRIVYKHPHEKDLTLAGFKKHVTQWFYNGMLGQRLDELQKQSNPPFTMAYSYYGGMVKTKNNYVSFAYVKEDGINRGFETLVTENERVKKYGFTATELERQKKEAMRYMESSYTERDKKESEEYIYEYINNFLENEPMPGIEFEYEFYKKHVPLITLDEINQLAKKWITDENRVIVITAPEKETVNLPSDEQFLSVLQNTGKKDIKAYKDKVVNKPLLAKIPKRTKVIEEKQFKEIGVTEWQMANGVKVVLKPTDFKNDDIQFSAQSIGGGSLYSELDDMSASYTAEIINQSGVGKHDNIQLQKVLTGKIVWVSTYISEISEGIYGGGSPKDFETIMQLIYLRFTQPRKDKTAFLSFMDQQVGFIQNRSASPEAAFGDTINVTISQAHYRDRPVTVSTLKEINHEKAFKIYQDRFADASDFTFYFVGNFNLDSIKPLVETYIGGLPAIWRKETWRDVGRRAPKGVISKIIKKGIEPKSFVRMIFTGDFIWNRKNRYDLSSLMQLVNIKLRESLREDKGKTYGVNGYGNPQHFPVETYHISIGFGCAPENTDSLLSASLKVIDDIKQNGASEKDIIKIKEILKKDRETQLKENWFWLNTISSDYFHKDNVLDVLDYEKYVDALTSDVFKKAANEYFNMNNFAKFVLIPEK